MVRTPIATPIRTSFGLMRARPTLLVRVTNATEVQGHGEVWCNFPDCDAEHRARLLDTEIAPRLLAKDFASLRDCYDTLTAALRLLRLKTDEAAPIAQAIAGIDISNWDMVARSVDLPLFALSDAPGLGVDRDVLECTFD